MVYHLKLNRQIIRQSKIAFLPGDPGRVPHVAKAFDSNAEEVANNREFRTYLGAFKNESILVTSTGIGGASTSIVVEELAQLGIVIFLRVGTTGAIQEDIGVGDVIIPTSSVRIDGTSIHYAPIEYPAASSHEISQAFIQSAEALKIGFHVGIIASSASFYPGEERYKTYSGYVIRRLQGSLKEWQRLNVLSFDMESASLFVACSALGLKAGCVLGVVNNRWAEEEINETTLGLCEQRAINVATNALQFLKIQ